MKWLSEHEQAKHAIYNIVHELVFFVCAQVHIGGAETWVTRMTWRRNMGDSYDSPKYDRDHSARGLLSTSLALGFDDLAKSN